MAMSSNTTPKIPNTGPCLASQSRTGEGLRDVAASVVRAGLTDMVILGACTKQRGPYQRTAQLCAPAVVSGDQENRAAANCRS